MRLIVFQMYFGILKMIYLFTYLVIIFMQWFIPFRLWKIWIQRREDENMNVLADAMISLLIILKFHYWLLWNLSNYQFRSISLLIANRKGHKFEVGLIVERSSNTHSSSDVRHATNNKLRFFSCIILIIHNAYEFFGP